jgi:general secretion pathway protein J
MLTGVETLTFRFLDRDGEWTESWPPSDIEDEGLPPLPLAIEFTLELDDYGEVSRVFALPG